MRTQQKIQKIQRALDHLSPHESHCTLCPYECGVNRLDGEAGFCESGVEAKLSHAVLHYGEEPVLSGTLDCTLSTGQKSVARAGSGTLFFSGCNLKCPFCQNYQLSWYNQGQTINSTELAETILALQVQGALNINLVSPMHLLIPILRGLKLAFEQGLHLPVVYNTNAFESVHTLSLLEGIVDIYLPDLKFFSPELSLKLCSRQDYFSLASLAIHEMYRQKPDLILNSEEIAQEGLIIRHLHLPGQKKDSLHILDWMAENVSVSVGLSLMSQYIPCFRAPEDIQKKVSGEDYWDCVAHAQGLGFKNLFIQPELFENEKHLTPDFNKKNPFNWTS